MTCLKRWTVRIAGEKVWCPAFPDIQKNSKCTTWSKDNIGSNVSKRPERKNVAWMKDTLQKFTKLDIRFVDIFAGKLSFFWAWLLLQKHKAGIRSQEEPSCLTEAMSQLIVMLARQVLIIKKDVYCNEECYTSAGVYVKSIKAIEVQRKPDLWEAPDVYVSLQMFTRFILFRLSNYFGEEEQLIMSLVVPTYRCSRKRRLVESMYDISLRFVVDGGAASSFWRSLQYFI